MPHPARSTLDDADRLEALRGTALLDAPPEPALERLTRLAARLLGAPTAVVTLVDADRQFFTSCLGLPEPWLSARETPLTHSFCRHVVEAAAPLVLEDAREHPTVRENLAIRDLGVIAYLGVPLSTRDGQVLGALAVIDGRPRAWREGDREILEDLAASVVTAIALRAEVRQGQATARALADREARFAEAQRVGRIGSWELDAATRAVRWSDELYRLSGLAPRDASVAPEAFYATIHPEDRDRMRDELRAHLAAGRSYEYTYRVLYPDGTVRVLRGRAEMVRDAAGAVVRVLGTAQDVTEWAAAEERLRESEARLAEAQRVAGLGSWSAEFPVRTVRWSAELYRLFGRGAPGDAGGIVSPEACFEAIHADDRERVRAALAAALAARRPFEVEYRVPQPDGSERVLCGRGEPAVGPDGAVLRMVGTAQDVTERARAAAALRASEARFRALVENTLELITVLDPAGRLVYGSPAWQHVLGYDPAALRGSDVFLLVHPEDLPTVGAAFAALALAAGEVQRIEYRIRHRDGSWRTVQTVGHNLLHEPAVGGLVINSRDVTLQRRLEAQLRQAQKMEAVGQLAGGIAHDFNNLLTVITAAVGFVRDTLPPEAPAGEDVAAIEAAAERAAELTRQLLAFSRQQILKPERLDVSEVVRGVQPMLRRLLGEDLEVVADLAPALPLVLADPGQLEQVLINLAVNARDAMPRGGRLVLGTAPVTVTAEAATQRGVAVAPGRYVRLVVRDTGEGMDAATLARLFEPFFTTKAPGKGTGLGLATVYGIVKQSGGYVWVTSAPGAGTTFEVDLPAAAPAPAPEAEGVAARAAVVSGEETLLLVEDDVAVRAMARRILARQGYTVLEAPHGAAALEVMERYAGPVDLVLTDVVMPEMSGRAFAVEIGRRRPGLPVLFMSGYTDDEILHRGLLAPGMAFLEKPFTAARLLAVVRDALSTPLGGGTGAPPR